MSLQIGLATKMGENITLLNPTLCDGETLTKERVDAALSGVHEILPGLLVGSQPWCAKAREKGYRGLSVRNGYPCGDGCVHKPFLDLKTYRTTKLDLDHFADELYEIWGHGEKVFVHCLFGIERAPLAVAYAIKRDIAPKHSFASVYAFVRKQRPMAIDRTAWLGDWLVDWDTLSKGDQQ